VTTEYVLKHQCIIGDTKTCKQRLEELWETTGGFGTLLMIAHDWDDKAKWLRSMDVSLIKLCLHCPRSSPHASGFSGQTRLPSFRRTRFNWPRSAEDLWQG
jgi:hypothetical protein